MRRSVMWRSIGVLGAASFALGCGDSGSAPSMGAGLLTPSASVPEPAGSEPSSDEATPASTDVTPLARSDADAPPMSGMTPPAMEAPASPDARAALQAALEAAVAVGDAPGIVGLVVDRDGVLFEGAAGALSVAAGTPMPTDAIFNIASMTKPVTSVAVMMLVERGELGLDDPVSVYLPGFDAPEVITSFDAETGAFETAPATVVMTVRHLLSHSSGLGYTFSNATVAELTESLGRSELEIPLLNEPGAAWNYSASTRALGQIVEGITGQTLEAFFQENLFEPLGMVDTSFAVPAERQARLPTLHLRTGNGALGEQPQGAPATPTPPFTGDGGLYSTARDYGRFMRMFLNGGELDGVRILSEESVAEMGQNQIGEAFVELQVPPNPGLSRPFPLGAGEDKFGLGFQITGSDGDGTARSAGSLAWAGLFNTEFWIDPSRGVAATLLVQVLPFYDEGALRALQGFESAVYQELLPR